MTQLESRRPPWSIGIDTASIDYGQSRQFQSHVTLCEHNVPVFEDQNLVEVLEALDVDTEIPAELYRAVAEVLVFIYRLNRAYDSNQAL